MEHALGPDWATGLEATAVAAYVRGSSFLYPLANVLHIFGISLVLGSIVVLDLRVLGVGRAIPLPAASSLLTRLIWLGFALILPSGVLMFLADAGPLAASTVFRLKMLLLLAALLNALLFRRLYDRKLGEWDAHEHRFAQGQAIVSLVLWPAVIVSGRLLGYL